MVLILPTHPVSAMQMVFFLMVSMFKAKMNDAGYLSFRQWYSAYGIAKIKKFYYEPDELRFGRIATVDLKSSNTGENGQVIYRMIVLQITIWIKIRLFECRDSKDVPHRQHVTAIYMWKRKRIKESDHRIYQQEWS